MTQAQTPPTAKPAKGRTASLKNRWLDADPDQRLALIVEAALGLLDGEGPDAVTMRRVAGRIGIGAMTLYTYVDGQHGLRLAITRAGFDQLNGCCEDACTLETTGDWSGGAKAYLRFALEHPHLYRLMFDTPMSEDELDLLSGGFEPFLAMVTERMAETGLTGDELAREARAAAGRHWIGLHGLAMLAISNRLQVLEGSLDEVLDDLLPHISPTLPGA